MCGAAIALYAQVACGVSHTLFLVEADEKQLEPFEIFEPETTIEDEPKPTVKHGTLATSLCEAHASWLMALMHVWLSVCACFVPARPLGDPRAC